MADATLRRQVVRLMYGRAIIGTILLGSATFMQITAPGSFAVNPSFFLIGLTYALTISYAPMLRVIDRHRWLVDLQLAVDAFIVSAFIYFTGGITSYFTSLYVLPVIAASTIQFRRGGLKVATLSTVLYGGLVLAQYLAADGLRTDPWLMSASVVLPAASVARYTIALNVFGFFASVTPDGVAMMTDIGLYLDFIMALFLAFGLAFEIPVATFIVVWAGLTDVATLRRSRSSVRAARAAATFTIDARE